MGELINPIEFMHYDKISDDVYHIDRNLIVRFNVSLSKTMPDGQRRFFHSEYRYSPTNKKGDFDSLITVRRSYDYYLSIENIYKDENGNKEFIVISPGKYMLFKYALEEVLRWFTSSKYSKLFAYNKKEEMIMVAPIPSYELNGLSKRIVFKPCILMTGEEERISGVEIDISSQSLIRMSLDKFMGMYYTLSNFNMLQSAQLMLAYLNRPEFGTNMMDFSSSTSNRSYFANQQFTQEPEKTVTMVNRRLGDKNLSVSDLE